MSLFRTIADKLNRYYTQILICGCNFLYQHETKKLLKLHPGDGSVLGENTWIENGGNCVNIPMSPRIGFFHNILGVIRILCRKIYHPALFSLYSTLLSIDLIIVIRICSIKFLILNYCLRLCSVELEGDIMMLIIGIW